MIKDKILFRQGCLIDPNSNSETIADLYVADGKIIALEEKPDGFHADTEVDCHGQLIAPGFIDLYTALREPGYSHKGNVASELTAAVKGGFTHVCVPPDSDPILDTPSVAEWLHSQSHRIAKAQVLPMGALTQGLAGTQLSEMAALKEIGCIAVSQAYHPLFDTQVLYRALQYAATYDLLVIYYPIDSGWQQKNYVHAGVENLKLGLPAMPVAAEVSEIMRILAWLPETGARVHFSRLSSARSVELIAKAKQQGLAVTADVDIHHLLFTENMYRDFQGYLMRTPLRSEEDRAALRQGVQQKVIDAVCSAHEPHEADAFLAPLIQRPAGVSALEFVWPMLVKLHQQMEVSWCQLIYPVTTAPARILNLNRGKLAVGQTADLTILSPTNQ